MTATNPVTYSVTSAVTANVADDFAYDGGSGDAADYFINGDLQRNYFAFNGSGTSAGGGTISTGDETSDLQVECGFMLTSVNTSAKILMGVGGNTTQVAIDASEDVSVNIGGSGLTAFNTSITSPIPIDIPYHLKVVHDGATNNTTVTLTNLHDQTVETETQNAIHGTTAASNKAVVISGNAGQTALYFPGYIWDMKIWQDSQGVGNPTHFWPIDDGDTYQNAQGTDGMTLAATFGTNMTVQEDSTEGVWSDQAFSLNDGLTEDTAWSNMFAAQALWDGDSTAFDNKTIAFKRGSKTNGFLGLYGTQNMTLDAYGTGDRPIVQNAMEIPTTAFADEGSNYYTVTSVNSATNQRMSIVIDDVFMQEQPAEIDNFDSGNVNTGSDQITLTAHSFISGDEVLYLEGTGGSIGGLTDKSTYYVKKVVDNDTIELYSDQGLTSIVDLTSAAGSSHTLVSTPAYDLTNNEDNKFWHDGAGNIHLYTTNDPTDASLIETCHTNGEDTLDLSTPGYPPYTVTTNLSVRNLDIRHGANTLFLNHFSKFTIENCVLKYAGDFASSTFHLLWAKGDNPDDLSASSNLTVSNTDFYDSSGHWVAARDITGANYIDCNFYRAGYQGFELLQNNTGIVFTRSKFHEVTKSINGSSVFRVKASVSDVDITAINCEFWTPYQSCNYVKWGAGNSGAIGAAAWYSDMTDASARTAFKAVNCTFSGEAAPIVHVKNATPVIDVRLINCLLLLDGRSTGDFAGVTNGIIYAQDTDNFMESSDTAFNDYGAKVITDHNYYYLNSAGTDFRIAGTPKIFTEWQSDYTPPYNLDGNSTFAEATSSPVNDTDRDKAGTLDLTLVSNITGSVYKADGTTVDPDVPSTDINGTARDATAPSVGCYEYTS